MSEFIYGFFSHFSNSCLVTGFFVCFVAAICSITSWIVRGKIEEQRREEIIAQGRRVVWIQKDKELYHPFPTKPLTVSFIHTSSYAGEVEITTELDAEERGIGSDKSDSTRTPRISNPP